MPTIDDFPVPDFICNYFAELIDKAPNSHIKEMPRISPELGRGIRPNNPNVNLIRQRLLARLKDKGKMDATLIHLMNSSGFNIEFIAIFSKQVISIFIEELLAVFGAARTLAAILVDERQEVRAIAIKYLESLNGDLPPEDKESGVKKLSSELGPFLGHINCLLSGDFSRGNDGSNHDKSRKINKIKKELQREIKSGKRLKKTFDDKINKKDSLISSLKEQVKREKGLRQKMEADTEALRLELSKTQQQVDDKINREVEHKMSANIRSWLVEPQIIEAASRKIAKNDDKDIQVRAAKALLEQERIDRNYGNRRFLRQRLLDLEELELQLGQAAKDSLNPLPDISQLGAEIEGEIASIKNLLHDIPEKNNICLKLEAKINESSSQTEFNEVRDLLVKLAKLGLLANKELQHLDHLLHNRLSRLYEKYSPKSAKKPANPVKVIKEYYHIDRSFVLVVDGYNVILSLAEIFREFFDNGSPGAAARLYLLKKIDKLLKNSDCHAEVFFDGEEVSQQNFSSAVRENFSGGGSSIVPNRADNAIITYLSSLPTQQGRQHIIVTDDRDLQAKARQQKACIMPLAQFVAYIG